MRAAEHDIIVIVDIEATCWKRQPPPPGEENEIIEVGVCTLDMTVGELANKRSILVKPTRSKVSPFCTKLTTLTQELVDTGVSFAQACAELERDYCTKSRMWGSWGNYDQRLFESQCESFGVNYPFGEAYVNIKSVFAEMSQLARQVGMMRALKMTHLPAQGTHHRGHDDAWNIARLLKLLIERHGSDILVTR
jgi:inhibitor of KinA sporulation pathway (predicted exonuclease)